MRVTKLYYKKNMAKKQLSKKFIRNELLLKSVANKYRLAILEYLRGHEYASVGAISEHIGASLHNTSKHLWKLEQSRIVTSREDGTYRMYHLVKNIHPIARYIISKL